MTGMLASVRNLQEANIVYQGGADIIDLKETQPGCFRSRSFKCNSLCSR